MCPSTLAAVLACTHSTGRQDRRSCELTPASPQSSVQSQTLYLLHRFCSEVHVRKKVKPISNKILETTETLENRLDCFKTQNSTVCSFPAHSPQSPLQQSPLQCCLQTGWCWALRPLRPCGKELPAQSRLISLLSAWALRGGATATTRTLLSGRASRDLELVFRSPSFLSTAPSVCSHRCLKYYPQII